MRQFYWARLARIYPLYMAGLILDLPRGLEYFLRSGEFLKIPISIGAYIAGVQAWHPRVATTWNAPAWSISVDAFFYLVFPWLVARGVSRSSAWRWGFVGSAMVVSSLVGVWALRGGLGLASAQAFVGYWPPLRLSEFMLGCVSGCLWHSTMWKRFAVPWRLMQSSSGVVVVVALSFEAEIWSIPPLMAPVFALVVFSAAASEVQSGTAWFGSRIMVLLGKSSYGLYILHMPIHDWMVGVGLRSARGWWVLGGYLFVVNFGALVIHHWFEEPMRRRLIVMGRRGRDVS